MKIKSVTISGFKRFADLRIEDIPESARLVVLAGPNGFGKSSLFDAFMTHHESLFTGVTWDAKYHSRTGSGSWQNSVKIEFYGIGTPDRAQAAKYFCFRTAYRNDPALDVKSLSRQGPAAGERRFHKMTETDAAVNKNYQRLFGNIVEDVLEREPGTVTMDEFRAKVLGSIGDAVSRLFPELLLKSLGNPLSAGTFLFEKGLASNFRYENLSGGEKNAFDLILDIVVKRSEYDDTVYCLDEPDTHMNPRVHGPLLEVLLDIIPEDCQVWIATHSIGMMRKAMDMEQAKPGSVVFLDFGEKDFDQQVTLVPMRPTRTFWLRSLEVALDDLAGLVAPKEIIVCEGSADGKNADYDARCYNEIFEEEFPETMFVSGGNSHEVSSDRLGLIKLLSSVVRATTVRRLIDRDDRSASEVDDQVRGGTMVLGERNLESYLWSEEVLTAFCEQIGRSDAIADVLRTRAEAMGKSKGRGNPPDDWKLASSNIFVDMRALVDLTGKGNDYRAFARDTLAPLIRPGTKTYEALKASIFP